MNGYESPSVSGPCSANPCGAVQIFQGYTKQFYIDLLYTATGLPYDLTGATQVMVGFPGTGGTAPVLEVLAALSFTAVATSTLASNTLTAISSVAGITLGMQASGAGLPVGTVVTQVNPAVGTTTPATVVLSNSATSTNAAATITFNTGMAVSTTATTTSASNQLTAVASTAGILVGQVVTGTGIPAATTVIAVYPLTSTVILSANATSSNTGDALAFSLPPQVAVFGPPGAGLLVIGVPAADSAFLQINPDVQQNQDLQVSVTNANGTVTGFRLRNTLNIIQPDYGVLP